MSEDADKQAPATKQKLDQARKKGQSSKSIDLVSTASLTCIAVGVTVVTPSFIDEFVKKVTWSIQNAQSLSSTPSRMTALVYDFAKLAVAHYGPVLIAAMIAAILSSMASSGLIFSATPISPDPSRLNPANGLKRIFSIRSLYELAKIIVKISFAYIAITFISDDIIDGLVSLQEQPASLIGTSWINLAAKAASAMIFVYAILSMIDLAYGKIEFAKKMRMSRHELINEHKQNEGDPQIKSKLKKLQRDLIQKAASIKNVRSSDVVITNPTHVAIAMKYRPNAGDLSPSVIASGTGFIAKLIVSSARKHRVPILQRPPLARKLLKETRIDSAIPVDTHEEVSHIYKWLLTLDNVRVFSK